MKQQIIYYENELEDEFSTMQIRPKRIGDEYQYEGRTFFRAGKLFFYELIAKPLAYGYLKLHYGHKIINRHLLKDAKKEGYFLYGNHTNPVADALIPSMLCFPKDVSVIVHPNNVSIPFLGRITPYLGALPLPDTMQANRNFMKAIRNRYEQKECIQIYPEAHIWPFYTKIRPFPATSFGYPISLGAKVYCFTNTYQKRRFRKTPRIVTYIDGPFAADTSLPSRGQKEQLRNQVYDAMCRASENNTAELIKYIKKTEESV